MNFFARTFSQYTRKMSSTNFTKRAVNRNFKGFEEGKESQWSGPFCFIQGADTQLGMIDSYIYKKTNITWDKEIKLVTKAIEAVNAIQPRPRFFVVCGDMVDAMPGNLLRDPQIGDFHKLFTKLHPDIPLVCVCGNHDVGDRPTHESIQSYYDNYGDDYFSFNVGGVLFIVINSQLYEDPSLVPDLAEAQETWLDEQLDKAKNGNYKHIIVFQHIPYFVENPEEDKFYFNFEKELRIKILQKLHDANVRAIFCGHYHRNAGGFYQNMEIVVTSAIGAQLGNDLSGFRIVKVLENTIKHDYYPIESVPKQIELTAETSPAM